jgi:ligand-binding SRPBCC domain-containing protein
VRVRELQCEVWLPLLPEELFPFFADAGNLDAITPPWLHFNIVTPWPIAMRAGALIDYKLRVRGLPLRWRTLIKVWQPPFRFVDEQLRGPYRQWIHTHTFEPRGGGTLARDAVQYAVPFDFIAHPLFVRRDLEKIFAFRHAALRERFGGVAQ